MSKSESAPKDFSSNSMFMLQVHLKAPTNTVQKNSMFCSSIRQAEEWKGIKLTNYSATIKDMNSYQAYN